MKTMSKLNLQRFGYTRILSMLFVFMCFGQPILTSGQIINFLNFPNPSSGHNGSKVVLYVHDWNCPIIQNGISVKNALFARRDDLEMVVVADWSRFSQSPDFYSTVESLTPRLAQEVMKEIQDLVKIDSVKPSRIECIGHGVGAHVCGLVGKHWNGRTPAQDKLGTIIGLNPTGPYFKTRSTQQLKKGDATYVEVWHTDRRYGLYKDIGNKDIYPQTGMEIQACNTGNPLKRNQCLHNAVTQIFLSSDSNVNETSTQETISMSILTLDVSPSMQNFGRIQSMVAASKRFINTLPTGYFLGIVIFGGDAFLAVGPTNISDTDLSRHRLLTNLPTPETQIANTSIGAGIFKSLDLIQSNFVLGRGCPDIILVTDGEENQAPFLRDVKPYLSSICTKIHTIALGDEADVGLEAISELTRGQTYFASDVDSLDKLTQSLIASSSSQFAPDMKPIMLPPKPLLLDVPVSFVFDDSIGKATTFLVSIRDPKQVEAELTAPDGIKYGVGNYTVDVDLHQLLFKLLEVQAGNWTIKLTSAGSNNTENKRRRRDTTELDKPEVLNTTTPTVFVTTYPTGLQQPIRLEATLNGRILTYGSEVPLVVEAALSKGNDSIIGAVVEAEIVSSDGSKIIVPLLDNGAGADERKDDGIYSRFISSQLSPGKRYQVDVRATSAENGSTQIRTNEGDPFKATGEQTTPMSFAFERQANAGSFRVSAEATYQPMPPNRIRDLAVVELNLQEKWATLKWTAAGREADNGTADTIQFKAFTSSGSNISQAFAFGQEQVLRGSLEPLVSGSIQNVTFSIPEDLWSAAINDESDLELDLYFTVRSYNTDVGWSEVSNPASAYAAFNEANESSGASIIQILIPILAILLIMAGICIYIFHRKRTALFNLEQNASDSKHKI